MRGGGRREGRGRGGGRGGGYGRRDSRPGGAAYRDDRDRRDRRPDYSPRRRADFSPRRRSSSPVRRARHRSGGDDDRGVTRDNRGPTRGGRVNYDGDCGGRMSYGADRSPPPGRGDFSYDEHDRPRHGHRDDYGGSRDLPRHERREDYGGNRDLPRHGHREDYGGNRDLPRHERREDYGGNRDLPFHERDIRDPPRGGCREGYERVAYRQEHDQYDREDRAASGTYNLLPADMLPDHPSDLNQPSPRSGGKESKYLRGNGDFSHNRDNNYGGSSGRRSILKDREFVGDDGMTLRISATESGRTTALYQESRSPSPRAALPPPPPLYPSVPPADTGFITGAYMKAVDGFGTGSTALLYNDNKFKYGDHVHDPYVERSRGTERHYSGNRDVLVEEDGGKDRLYSSKGMLGSDLVSSTQLKQIGDSSSPLLPSDRQYRMRSEPDFEPSNGYVMNGHGMPPHVSLGHGRVSAHGFSRRSFEHGSDHSDEALLDITRQKHSKLAPRAEPMEYDEHDYVTRDPIIDRYVASKNINGNVSPNPMHILGSASLTGLRDERTSRHLRLSHRMADDEDNYQEILHDSERNRQDSYGIHASVPYSPARGGSDCYSHSPGFEPLGTARRPARFASSEDGRDLSDREVSPMVYRNRHRSPASYDHEMDMHQADGEFAGWGYHDMVEHDLSPRRMSRSYDMVDEDELDSRYDLPINRNVFSRITLPHEISGRWPDAVQGHPHSSTLAYGHSKHKPLAQRLSRPIAHSKFGAPSVQGRGKGVLTNSGKKRMRATLHHFDGEYASPGKDFIRPNKYPKSSEVDIPNESEMEHEDTPEVEDLPLQKDPPEGSEEFTKQVQQAFLKYTKTINESPAMQKKFRDAVNGSLSCCVCGSVARKFADLDALVTHAYNTCKVGLKTKHLGFHKALCVLMGWNWRVAPDVSNAHHSVPAEEVNAMKGDLILWPPVIVIHNSSIAIKTKDTESRVVSKEEIEGLLADIGIPPEKGKVSHGRSTNQSVFLVTFQPTMSGFQEAMKIHDHFCAKNHGKEEFQHMRGGKGKQAAPMDNMDELLYAHIAVAEDLVYLDDGMKRRCVVKSKMEIVATAEATLSMGAVKSGIK